MSETFTSFLNPINLTTIQIESEANQKLEAPEIVTTEADEFV